MCWPVMIAGMMAAGAAANSLEQRRTYKDAQKQMQNQALMMEKQTAQAFQDLAMQQVTVRDQTMQQLHENQLRGKQALSQVSAAYGESGVEGKTVDAVMKDLMGQAALNADTISADYTNRMVSLDLSAQRNFASAQDQIKGLGKVRGPSLGASLLSIGSAGAQGYAMGQGMTESNALSKARKGDV